MSLTQEVAVQVLLACVANPDGNQAGQLASLAETDQQHLFQLARELRCAPLLHHIASRTWLDLPISPQLAEEAREQALQCLSQARGLVRCVRILREAGMEPIALKGVALAWRDYPAPQLRVLRDVDLLLPADQVERAHRLLLSQEGYSLAPWAGQYGTEYGHQLPEIVDRVHGLVIELHHRLNARGWAGDRLLTQMVRDEARVLDLMGEGILAPSAHANLLHLVEHATLHHAFANGPAILADMHYLGRGKSIDWDTVTADARELGLEKPLNLLAELGRRLGASWVPSKLQADAGIGDEVIAGAVQAMFADAETHRQFAQLWRLAGHSGGEVGAGQAATRALRPNRYQLARLSGHAPDSILRWLGYPSWLLEKGRRFFRARRTIASTGEYVRYAALRGWIESGQLSADDFGGQGNAG